MREPSQAWWPGEGLVHLPLGVEDKVLGALVPSPPRKPPLACVDFSVGWKLSTEGRHPFPGSSLWKQMWKPSLRFRFRCTAYLESETTPAAARLPRPP